MPGAVQIVFGVENPNDPAIAVVERLRAAYPGAAIELVVDPRAMGSNPKIANLINMSARIAHDIVVLADSDIRVRRDYLSRLVGALERFGGAVTCPYYGISTGSLWSQLAQLTIDSHFLPGVVVGARLKLSRPCLGSTIALRRQSLVGDRRLRAARRLPGRRLCAGRTVAAARRAGDGAAVRGRPCLRRIVALPNCGGTSCAGR